MTLCKLMIDPFPHMLPMRVSRSAAYILSPLDSDDYCPGKTISPQLFPIFYSSAQHLVESARSSFPLVIAFPSSSELSHSFLLSILHASLCYMAVNTEQDPSPRPYQHLEEDHNLSNHFKHDLGKDAPTEAAEDDFPTDHQSKQRVAVVMTSLSVRKSI